MKTFDINKSIIIFLFLLGQFIPNITYGQIVIDWEQCIPIGNQFQNFGIVDAVPTADGGYIIAINTSINGNSQFGLMKLDSLRQTEWIQQYGGTSFDGIRDVLISAEGGYLLIGTTWSNDGDVTNFHGGQGDGWVIKTDTAGNLQWQKTFGGSDHESLYEVIQNQAGEYIVTGQTGSSDGDLTGLNPWGGL